MIPRRTCLCLLPALLAPAAWAARAESGLPDPLLVGLISTESTTQLRKDWQPLLDDLGRTLGVRVQAFFAGDYAGVVEAMRFGKVHVAWLGNKAAIEAVDRAGAEVFARGIPASGQEGYHSILLSRRQRGVDSLDDVWAKGGSLVYGGADPNSTSGTLIPAVFLFGEKGIDPRRHFKAARASTHEANLLALAAGQVDLAINNSDDFAKFSARFPARAAGLQVLWTSPLIPSDPMVWKADLPAPAKERIRAFWVNYGQGPDAGPSRAVLAKLQLSGFRATDNGSLAALRVVELRRKRLGIEADAILAPAERARKLAELDAALRALELPAR